MNNNVFQFKSRELELDIAGKVFVLDLSKEGAVDSMLEVGSQAIAKAQELKAVPEVDGTDEDKARQGLEILAQANAFVLEAVDKILGAGASDKIFEGRRKDFFDTIDLLGFVLEKVREANEERISSRSTQYSNRAQKRAVKKTKKA